MGATDRVKQYLEYKGITKYKFYQKTKLSNKFLDNSSNMGTNKAEIILRYYPDINPVWLLTGKGNMLLVESASEPDIKTEHTVTDNECKVCKEKDARLKMQEETIKDLKYDKAELREQLLETKLRLEEAYRELNDLEGGMQHSKGA